MSTPARDTDGNPVSEAHPLPTSQHLLGHMLTQEDFDTTVKEAYLLTKPIKNEMRDLVDPTAEAKAEYEHEEKHARVVEALRRIVSLDNTDSKMRKHVNIARCIDEFGRHHTDKVLQQKPDSIHGTEPKPERAGPDTGSSEVQIAILTMKDRKSVV